MRTFPPEDNRVEGKLSKFLRSMIDKRESLPFFKGKHANNANTPFIHKYLYIYMRMDIWEKLLTTDTFPGDDDEVSTKEDTTVQAIFITNSTRRIRHSASNVIDDEKSFIGRIANDSSFYIIIYISFLNFRRALRQSFINQQ